MSAEAVNNPNAPATHAKTRRLGRGLASLMSNTRIEPLDPPPSAAAPESIEKTASTPDSDIAGRYAAVSQPPNPTIIAGVAGKPLEIDLNLIQPNPHQPRRTFAEADLAELTESIRRQGILQPLLVMNAPTDSEAPYTLIAGERRLRAAKLAGLKTVPCVIRPATREQLLEWALIENVQRADLNPVERALAYRDYLDRFQATQQQLAEHLGQPRSTIANYLRILDLCDGIQALLLSGDLSFGHAKILAALAGKPERQLALARKAIENSLSVRQLEELIAATQGQPNPNPPAASKSRDKSQLILDIERQLTHSLGTRVMIRPGRGKHTGRLIVEYYNLEDFDRITEALGAKIES